jgi:hypothetical protein
MQQPKVRRRIAEEERIELQDGTEIETTHPHASRSMWVMSGIEIEESQ